MEIGLTVPLFRRLDPAPGSPSLGSFWLDVIGLEPLFEMIKDSMSWATLDCEASMSSTMEKDGNSNAWEDSAELPGLPSKEDVLTTMLR